MKKHKILVIGAVLLFSSMGVAVTSAKAEQSAAEQSIQAGPYRSQLGEFRMTIAGDEITLPVSYKELKNRGWNIEPESEGAEIYGEDYLVSGLDFVRIGLSKGSTSIFALVQNGELSAQRLGDLKIYYLSYLPTEDTSSVILPGNIIIGEAYLSDLKAAYGEPTREISGDVSIGDGSRYHGVNYDFGDYQTFYFSYRNGTKIDSVSIFNNNELYQRANEHLNNFIPSPEVLAYQAPSGLGTDLSKLTFEFEGDVYQFPAPLTAFKDKGWNIKPQSIDSYYLSPGEESSVYIERNGIRRCVSVKNNSAERALVQDFFITYITDDIVLPNGLKRGMSEAAALQIIKSSPYIYDREQDRYQIKGENPNYEILIWFDNYYHTVLQVMICDSN